jgi:hypothetical protein
MYHAFFATAYGENQYNTNNYNGTTATGTATGGSAGGSAGGAGLANTGFDVLLIVTLAAVLMFAAVIVRFIKRPTKTKSVK